MKNNSAVTLAKKAVAWTVLSVTMYAVIRLAGIAGLIVATAAYMAVRWANDTIGSEEGVEDARENEDTA